MKLFKGYAIAAVSFVHSLGTAGAFANTAHSSLDTDTNQEFHDHGLAQQDGTIQAAKDKMPRGNGRELKGQGMGMMSAMKMNVMNGGMKMKGSTGAKGSSKSSKTASPTLKPSTRPTTVQPTTIPSGSPSAPFVT